MNNSQIIETYQTVVGKAMADDAYKAQLIQNPAKAIESVLGKKVPSDLQIVVVDQSDASKIHVNIPPQEIFDQTLELTDEQLEAVAGGASPAAYSAWVGGAFVVGIAAGAISKW